MALLKPITQNNGIVLSYHRVTTLTIHTNNQNIIEILNKQKDVYIFYNGNKGLAKNYMIIIQQDVMR